MSRSQPWVNSLLCLLVGFDVGLLIDAIVNQHGSQTVGSLVAGGILANIWLRVTHRYDEKARRARAVPPAPPARLKLQVAAVNDADFMKIMDRCGAADLSDLATTLDALYPRR